MGRAHLATFRWFITKNIETYSLVHHQMFKLISRIKLAQVISQIGGTRHLCQKINAMVVKIHVVYCGAWGYEPKFKALRDQLMDEFRPEDIDISGEATPGATGFFWGANSWWSFAALKKEWWWLCEQPSQAWQDHQGYQRCFVSSPSTLWPQDSLSHGLSIGN